MSNRLGIAVSLLKVIYYSSTRDCHGKATQYSKTPYYSSESFTASITKMGIPFNFNCNGVGLYICSRCGFELFSTDDKIEKRDLPYPISFSKALSLDAVIKIQEPPIPPPRRTRSSSIAPIPIGCGRCQVPIGILYPATVPTTNGGSYFDIEWKALLFVPRKFCARAVPWSFLI